MYLVPRNGFGVAHDSRQLWKQGGLLTSAGTPLCNEQYVATLSGALQLPLAVAIVKCQAHASSRDDVAIGNALAAQSARNAALHSLPSASAIFIPCPKIRPPSHACKTLCSCRTTSLKSRRTFGCGITVLCSLTLLGAPWMAPWLRLGVSPALPCLPGPRLACTILSLRFTRIV